MKKARTQNSIQLLLLLISVVLLVILVVFPLLSLFSKAFQEQDGSFAGIQNFITYFTSPNLVSSLYNTLFVSGITALIAVFLASLYAYALTRTGVRGKNFFRFTAMLPLFAPTMMLAIGLIYLMGNKGLLTGLGIILPLYGPFGIIVAEVIYTFPQAVMILMVSLSFADNRLYEAADAMGTSSLRKFTTITFPSIRYGLVSSFFVAFTLSFTDFGAPKVVGGNYNVLAKDIYKHVVGSQNFNMGAVAGILLMTPAILSFAADRILQSKHSGTVNAKTVNYVIPKSKSRDILFTGYCVLINVVILGLMGTVLLASLVKIWPYDMSLTLQHFFFSSPATGGSGVFLNSIIVSVITAILGTCFVFMNAYLIEKVQGYKNLRRTISLLSIIPLAMPGLALGIAYIFFFSNSSNPLKFFYGTMWILVLSNLIHFYSVPFVTASSALKKLDKEFETVSESMRVPFYKTIFRVTIPMSMDAILEILLYFFVNSMVTISAVVFLYPANFKLAAIAIVNMEDAGDIAPAAALSVLLIITNILVRIAYEGAVKIIQNKKRKRASVE